jgi:RNA recognition motif-containing protein
MNIYVGNLPYSVTEQDLRELFESCGEVASANVIIDKFTKQSKGFGFIEMPSQEEAMDAIDKINDQDFQGRNLKVNEAKPRNDSYR